MSHMSQPASQTQWYLARDGQQYGPLSETELHKIVELGHLQPTDLLWREGFADWRPALVVFPPRRPGVPRPPAAAPRPPGLAGLHAPPGAREQWPPRQGPMARGAAGAGMRQGHPLREPGPEPEEGPSRGGRLKRAVVVLLCLGALGAAGSFAYPRREMLIEYMRTLPSRLPGGLLGTQTSQTNADRRNVEASPLAGFVGAPKSVDAALQATPLWRVVKQEFPDWYGERLKEAEGLAAQNKDDAAIAQQMARALVALRRENAKHALAASFPHLKAVATAFYDNLVQLRKHSAEACYEFISKGEASPTVISLMQSPKHTAHLQAQVTAVFEAVADGRKSPRVYPRPRQADYDLLIADLARRGWSKADVQTFGDPRALSQAGPEKFCQLVHDWFAAQLALKDEEVQLRLLVEALRPLFAG
jgi:hypothetical protein